MPCRPLKGLTVVTLEHAIAAPFATRQLADLGARVIKIERPGVGDFARGYDARVRGLASHFVWTNRSKESLTLDVKHPRRRRRCSSLVLEKADVVVQNLAPGAAARLGLGYEALSERRSRRSSCATSPATATTDGPGLPRQEGLRPADPERGRASSRSRARPTSRARPARRSPTSPPACTPTPTSSRRCCSAADAGGASTSTSRCWNRWPNGRAIRCTTPSTAHRRRRAPAQRTRRSIPTARSPPGDGSSVMLGLQNEREWSQLLRQGAAAARTRAGRALHRQRQARGRARGPARDHRRDVLAALSAGRWWSGWKMRRSPTPGSTRCRTCGTPAAEGARTLARGGVAGRAVAGDVAAGVLGRRRRAWTRCPRWASTPTRSWPSWASMRPAFAALRAAEAV